MSILQKIVAEKEREVARLPARPATLENALWTSQAFGPRRGFIEELKHPRSSRMALIAEIKKASPSAGLISKDFDPIRIARQYAEAGASCLSVLTDAPFFQGSLQYLREIRDAVQLPLLRKDFIIEERQVIESLEWGADAILLIVAILSDEKLRVLNDLAIGAGLDVLVEVHDSTELKRALAIRPRLLGINNRDLQSFKVDLATTEQLAAEALAADNRPEVLVAESGIHTASDVQRVWKAGARAILVGEALMREGDPRQKAAELLAFSA